MKKFFPSKPHKDEILFKKTSKNEKKMKKMKIFSRKSQEK
jgi:hypothetical protein